MVGFLSGRDFQAVEGRIGRAVTEGQPQNLEKRITGASTERGVPNWNRLVLILRKPLLPGAERGCTLFLNQRRRQRIKAPCNELSPSLIEMAAILCVTLAQFLACLVPILEGANLAIGAVGFNIGDVKQDPAVLSRPLSETIVKRVAQEIVGIRVGHQGHRRVNEHGLRKSRFQIRHRVQVILEAGVLIDVAELVHRDVDCWIMPTIADAGFKPIELRFPARVPAVVFVNHSALG